jgi:hypothetical protein
VSEKEILLSIYDSLILLDRKKVDEFILKYFKTNYEFLNMLVFFLRIYDENFSIDYLKALKVISKK